MKEQTDPIGVRELFGVYCRSFLLQAAWSYDRMQSVGFAYALEPVLRKLYQDPVEYEARLRLHLEYFNTQPYFASFVLGAAVRMEQNRVQGESAEVCDIAGLKASLMAPLGALGDSLVWGALKPMTAIVAAAVCILGYWWAPLMFLVIYNVGHAGLRAWLLWQGYIGCGNAVTLVSRFRFTAVAKWFKVLSLCFAGALIGMLPVWRTEFRFSENTGGFRASVLAMTATLALAAALRRGGSPVKFMLGLAAVCIVLAYAGVV